MTESLLQHILEQFRLMLICFYLIGTLLFGPSSEFANKKANGQLIQDALQTIINSLDLLMYLIRYTMYTLLGSVW